MYFICKASINRQLYCPPSGTSRSARKREGRSDVLFCAVLFLCRYRTLFGLEFKESRFMTFLLQKRAQLVVGGPASPQLDPPSLAGSHILHLR